jgi:hypothetical protein
MLSAATDAHLLRGERPDFLAVAIARKARSSQYVPTRVDRQGRGPVSLTAWWSAAA